MMRIGFALAVALVWGTGCLDAGPGYLIGKTPPYVRNTSPDMGNLIQRGDYLEGTGNDIPLLDLTPQLVITFSKAMDPDPSLLAAGIVVCCVRGTSTNVSLVQPSPQRGQLQETQDTGDVPFTVITSPVPLLDGGVAPDGGVILVGLDRGTGYTLMVKTVLHDDAGTPLREEVRVPFSTTP